MSFALSRGEINSASEMRDSVDVAAILEKGAPRVFLMDPAARLAVTGLKEVGVGAERAPASVYMLPDAAVPWILETSEPSHLWFFGVDEEERPLVGVWLTKKQKKALFDVLEQADPSGEHPQWDHLMFFGADLEDEDALVATQGVALANWHRMTRFCSSCGERLDPTGAGWTRTCSGCQRVHFPHIEPAIIVSVRDPDDRLLLVHNKAWDAPRMSLLAGYVDAGETPERAVAREVKEESDLEVTSIKYLGAQPWPWPRSLMFVYDALVECDEDYVWQPGKAEWALPCATPTPDQIEVDRAEFFTREALRKGLAEGEVKVPGPASVAHVVIDAWMTEDGGTGLFDPETWSGRPPRLKG